jgi:hypothetical protein
MKLVYHVKFRANFGLFKVTLGEVYGETDLNHMPVSVLEALLGWLKINGETFITFVNERGVYIALNLE